MTRKETCLKLASLREARRLTQQELAELIGIKQSTVSSIEAGRWNVGIDTLIAFGNALEFKIDFVDQKSKE